MEFRKDYQVITVSFNYHDTPQKAAQKNKPFCDAIIKVIPQTGYF